jgi:hypothetical protein
MPGGYGTSGPWGSSGDIYGNKPSAPPGRDPGGHHFGGENQDNQNNQVNQESQAAQAASQALHAQQMQEMAREMQVAGQISGGLSGGTYTKGPVVYPKEFYTHEGWAEVQKKGWSDKLYQGKIQGRTPSEWILDAEKPQDVGGGLTTLPEGILYSSNIGDPETGYGGTIRTPSFVPPGNDNDGQSYNYGYGYGGGSSGVGGYGTGVHPRSFYKGLPYQDFSGKEVHKMLDFDQKIEAANILSGLSQGAQAFAMDPKARGILAVLQA